MPKSVRSPVREVVNTVAPIAQATSSAAINQTIKKVQTAFGKVNDLVQDAAVAIIVHASLYGDCTGAARLLDAMPKSSRRGLVQTFFTRYSPISVVLDTKTKKMKARLRDTDSKAYNKFDVDGARANKWYESPEAEKEPEVLTMEDLKTSFDRFIARMKKLAADPKHVAAADKKTIDATISKLEAVKL